MKRIRKKMNSVCIGRTTKKTIVLLFPNMSISHYEFKMTATVAKLVMEKIPPGLFTEYVSERKSLRMVMFDDVDDNNDNTIRDILNIVVYTTTTHMDS